MENLLLRRSVRACVCVCVSVLQGFQQPGPLLSSFLLSQSSSQFSPVPEASARKTMGYSTVPTVCTVSVCVCVCVCCLSVHVCMCKHVLDMHQNSQEDWGQIQNLLIIKKKEQKQKKLAEFQFQLRSLIKQGIMGLYGDYHYRPLEESSPNVFFFLSPWSEAWWFLTDYTRPQDMSPHSLNQFLRLPIF